LNRYLADTYGLDTQTQWKSKKEKENAYQNWKNSHRPFHWLAEFYEIISKGGFDVVIGNPPYVGMSKINYKLMISDFHSSDIFSYVIKRSFELLNKRSRYGFIVMHNLSFSRNFSDTRRLIRDNANMGWFSFYARIPAGLFSGDVRVRNCIFLLEKGRNTETPNFFTTRIHRWFAESREYLFNKLDYARFNFSEIIPMFNSHLLANFFQNMNGKELMQFEAKKTKHLLYFKQSAYNWISVSQLPAPCYDETGEKIPQTQVKNLALCSEEAFIYSLLFLNGKLFFSYWLTYGDEFHLTKDDLVSIKVPYDTLKDNDKTMLKELGKEFSNALKDTIQYKLNAGKKVGTFNTSKLWHITDKTDRIFLNYLSDMPVETFEAIQDHIAVTVITNKGEEETDE